MTSRHSKRARRHGFSLAECAFSLLLTAVVIVGALQSAAMTQRLRLQVQTRSRGTELAQLLLTEVMQSYYADPGSSPTFGKESGEFGRSTLNDVDDYDNFTEFLAPKNKSGTSLSGYTWWSRSVEVDWVDPADPTGASSSTETGLKRIKVTASYINGDNVILYALRSNKGVSEQKPSTATTYVEWAGAKVTVGSGSAVYTGANLINNAQ
jgi:Tfp pilus assembly protein PilV